MLTNKRYLDKLESVLENVLKNICTFWKPKDRLIQARRTDIVLSKKKKKNGVEWILLCQQTKVKVKEI